METVRLRRQAFALASAIKCCVANAADVLQVSYLASQLGTEGLILRLLSHTYMYLITT